MKILATAILAATIAGNASANAYWEATMDHNDLDWSSQAGDFIYSAWAYNQKYGPSKWQSWKINYINQTYAFYIDDVKFSNRGIGLPDLTTPNEYFYKNLNWIKNDMHSMYSPLLIDKMGGSTGGYKFTPTGIILQDATDPTIDGYYEFLAVPGLQQEHAKGWTGKGITLQVNDFGGHGKDVTKMAEFIAPGANVNFNNFHNPGMGYSPAHITNNSWGTSLQKEYGDKTAIQQMAYSFELIQDANENALHVWSTRNTPQCVNAEGKSQSSLSSCDSKVMIFNEEGEPEGTHILVGWEDHSQDVGEGEAMNHYIVSDGISVYNEQGSSFAAPRVAGVAAMVMQKFGTTKEQTKQILLKTADDLGAPGVDSVYGHGRLNAGSAMTPVGELN